ncbi:hypothetical protein UlMin_031926, partial [Ulmus minor]
FRDYYVYQYLKLLCQVPPQEWICKEIQDIGNMEFRFSEEQLQDDYAVELAENLLLYPAKHVIYGDYVYKIWDEKLIKHVLGFFTPENMRVNVVSKSSFKSEACQCEPWFGSRYFDEDISSSLIEMWRDRPRIDDSLHLPSKNEFILFDFSIRADDVANVSSPRCIRILDQPLMKFWYKIDDTFKLPRTNSYMCINLKGAYDDVKRCVLTELFIHLLKDELNELVYQASVAKLETSVSFYGDKLELRVDKLPVLLSKLLAVAKSFLPTDDRFKAKEEEAQKVAYDVLLEICSSLKGMSTPSSDGPYQKLVNMITVIIEILIWKCGFSAVEQVTQDKYRCFVKSVAE